jgi:hypothetical protein
MSRRRKLVELRGAPNRPGAAGLQGSLAPAGFSVSRCWQPRLASAAGARRRLHTTDYLSSLLHLIFDRREVEDILLAPCHQLPRLRGCSAFFLTTRSDYIPTISSPFQSGRFITSRISRRGFQIVGWWLRQQFLK